MKEKVIEEYLRQRVKGLGGKAYKFESPGNAGVPDRLVVLPGGRICFVELKNETGRLSSIQKNKIRELKNLGCDVIVAYSKDDVDRFISCCQEVMEE